MVWCPQTGAFYCRQEIGCLSRPSSEIFGETTAATPDWENNPDILFDDIAEEDDPFAESGTAVANTQTRQSVNSSAFQSSCPCGKCTSCNPGSCQCKECSGIRVVYCGRLRRKGKDALRCPCGKCPPLCGPYGCPCDDCIRHFKKKLQDIGGERQDDKSPFVLRCERLHPLRKTYTYIPGLGHSLISCDCCGEKVDFSKGVWICPPCRWAKCSWCDEESLVQLIPPTRSLGDHGEVEVGEGTYGRVRRFFLPESARRGRGRCRLPACLVVKTAKLEGPEQDHKRQVLENELNTLSRLHHPNVVRYRGSRPCEGDEPGFEIFMDFITGADLQKCLEETVEMNAAPPVEQEATGFMRTQTTQSDGGYVNPELKKRQAPIIQTLDDVIRCLKQILQGLAYIHSYNLVHRDLKPRNIAVESKFERIILLDLGSAAVDERTTYTAEGTTLNHTPPELLSMAISSKVDTSADIWAVGVIALTMLTGRANAWDGCSCMMAPVDGSRGDSTESLFDRLRVQTESNSQAAATVRDALQQAMLAHVGGPVDEWPSVWAPMVDKLLLEAHHLVFSKDNQTMKRHICEFMHSCLAPVHQRRTAEQLLQLPLFQKSYWERANSTMSDVSRSVSS